MQLVSGHSQIQDLKPDIWYEGELAHHLIKRLYGLTNKKDAMKQIGKKYNRQEALCTSTNHLEAREMREAESKSLANHHIISES